MPNEDQDQELQEAIAEGVSKALAERDEEKAKAEEEKARVESEKLRKGKLGCQVYLLGVVALMGTCVLLAEFGPKDEPDEAGAPVAQSTPAYPAPETTELTPGDPEDPIPMFVISATAVLRSAPRADADILAERERGDGVLVTPADPESDWLQTHVIDRTGDGWAPRDAWVLASQVGSSKEAMVAAGKLRNVLKDLLGEPDGAKRNAKAYCEKEWRTDFVMQKDCLESQRAGWESLREAEKQFKLGTRERRILVDCVAKWTADRNTGVNWEMAEHCAREQIDAYRALQAE